MAYRVTAYSLRPPEQPSMEMDPFYEGVILGFQHEDCYKPSFILDWAKQGFIDFRGVSLKFRWTILLHLNCIYDPFFAA